MFRFHHRSHLSIGRPALLSLILIAAALLALPANPAPIYAAENCGGLGRFGLAQDHVAKNSARWDARRANRSGHVTEAVNTLGNPGDENWAAGFDTNGTNNPVYATTFDSNGNLYAGGCFDDAGGVTVNHIGMWDGTQWNALGFGFGPDDVVGAIAVDENGDVYAGGFLTEICLDVDCTTSSPVNSLAMWDGTQWSSVEFGLAGEVIALEFDGSGLLYIGGDFVYICEDFACAAGDIALGIATWDGSALAAFGFGFAGAVLDLEFDHNGTLFAGGEFFGSCDDEFCTTFSPLNFIAEWDGSAWQPLAFGVDFTVHALAFDSNNQLYLGGEFEGTCEDLDCCGCTGELLYGIARWDGTAYHALDFGLEYYVFALAIDSADNVYPGGLFIGSCSDETCNDGGDSPYVIKWNGSEWSAPGSAIGPYDDFFNGVAALAYSGDTGGNNGNLFVGGIFETAGDKDALNIAQWTAANGTIVDGPGTYEFYSNNLPVIVEVVNAGNLARINIQRVDMSHPDGGLIFDNGFYWMIEGLDENGDPATGFLVNLTLPTTYTATANSKVCRFTGITWQCHANSFTTDSVTRNGVSQFSDWATGEDVPTALDLAGLSARVQPDKNVVKWQTTTEAHIAGFNVWRKKGNGAWKQLNAEIRQAKHAGNAAGEQYRYRDFRVGKGKTYRYKLEVIYLDGRSEWTGVVKVTTP